MLETLIKRDGTQEAFKASKVNHWAVWAGRGLEGRLDWSSIVTAAIRKAPAVMSTQDFQMSLITGCLEKMAYPELKMAGTLYAVWLQKNLYFKDGSDRIPTVKELHDIMIADDLLRPMNYSDEDYARIETIINHDNDFKLTHPEIQTLFKKYGVQNRVTGKAYETPQFIFIRVAMAICENYEGELRFERIKSFYEKSFVQQLMNAPSPNFTNLGTYITTYASCCLIAAGDTKTSIDISDVIAYQMTCASAGIGEIKMIRSLKDPVMNGLIEHSGKAPYYQATAKKVRSSKQNGRGGALTEYISCFDPEVMEVIRAQNPRTPILAQNRECHFSVMTNSLFHKKFALNQDIFTFNCYTAPDLYEAFFHSDGSVFETLYEKYEQDPNFNKNYIPARDIVYELETQAREVSTVYHLDIGEVNRHTPFLDPIYSSNLCVSGYTNLLTKEYGYRQIRLLNNQEVHVWNGEEWSKTTVVKTGENQKLLSVFTDSGTLINATEYHKWYVHTDKGIVEKRTHELQEGDKLIKHKLGVIDHGNKELLVSIDSNQFVPDNSYSLKSRFDWLSDLIETKGQFVDVQGRAFIQIRDCGFDFLFKVKLFLQELGVNSTVEGIAVSQFGLIIDDRQLKLLRTNIINNTTSSYTGSDVEFDKFVTIKAVMDNGKFENTYCVNEPKRHMAMFEGVLTGQCTEITQPTKPYLNYEDLFTDNHHRGEVSICNLGGVNVAIEISDELYEEICYNALDMIDKTLDLAKFPFKHIEYTAKARRNAAVGIVGLAEHMARKKLKYDTPEGLKEIDRVHERHYYFLVKAALRLGKERGNAPWIYKTKWPQGWLPIDTYKKTVDELVPFELRYDWEDLRQQVIDNKGIRFSVLCAMMPTETSARVLGSPNGVYPIRRGYVKKPDMTTAIDWVPRDYDLLKDDYQLAYDIEPVDQMKFYAVMQKWTDHTISADQFDNRIKKPFITESEIYEVFYTRVKYGLKARYYLNSLTSKEVKMLAIDIADEQQEAIPEDTIMTNNLDASGEEMCPGGFCSL